MQTDTGSTNAARGEVPDDLARPGSPRASQSVLPGQRDADRGACAALRAGRDALPLCAPNLFGGVRTLNVSWVSTLGGSTRQRDQHLPVFPASLGETCLPSNKVGARPHANNTTLLAPCPGFPVRGRVPDILTPSCARCRGAGAKSAVRVLRRKLSPQGLRGRTAATPARITAGSQLARAPAVSWGKPNGACSVVAVAAADS